MSRELAIKIHWRENEARAILGWFIHGQTWTIEWHPKSPPQAVQAYLAKNYPGISRFKDTPLDATFDPRSGNLIFAMGHDGVLVRLPDGSYTQVGVGNYQPARSGFGQMLLTLRSNLKRFPSSSPSPSPSLSLSPSPSQNCLLQSSNQRSITTLVWVKNSTA